MGVILRQFGIADQFVDSADPRTILVRRLEEAADAGLLELGECARAEDTPADVAPPYPTLWAPDSFRLFLSHTHHIAPPLAELKDEPERYGVHAFVAHRDIEPASRWENVIEAALSTCDGLAAFVTDEFPRSA